MQYSLYSGILKLRHLWFVLYLFTQCLVYKQGSLPVRLGVISYFLSNAGLFSQIPVTSTS